MQYTTGFLDTVDFVFKRLMCAGDRNLGIVSGGSQGQRMSGGNSIKEEEEAKHWVLMNIAVRELMRPEKPTGMSEECSERSKRMNLGSEDKKELPEKEKCVIRSHLKRIR